jgi:CBS domain-containing membrane protein
MQTIKDWFGVELDPVSGTEKLVSVVGGVIAILLIVMISQNALHLTGSSMLIASMGASAVLLFAVPHGQLSQPWPVIAGHIFSAIIGVTCAKLIPYTPLAAACAVGLSIGAMHQFKCIHPPGGATALTAVIGGQSVHELGYGFIWSPVTLNVLVIVIVAIAFNYGFPWRKYPAFLNHKKKQPLQSTDISHEEVIAALRRLDSFVDVTEDDLLRLYEIISTNHAGHVALRKSEPRLIP